MKQLGTELDRMQLFHPLEENFKTLMHRLISLSHADPLFKKFIAFCSRAKIAFSYLPFYLSRISAFRRHLELASMSRLNESQAYQDQQAYL